MSNKTFENYFQHELSKIRELSKEFSKEYPAVAPLLDAHNSDPDAERLIEGVAFLTGLLQQKLDGEFPEVIHELTNILFPHYLRPVPALSVLEFTPKASLRESIKIPKGTQVNSVAIEDVQCTFTTTSSFDIYPMKLNKSSYTVNDSKNSSLQLDIDLINTNLGSLSLDNLNFYLGDSYNNSSNLFMLLSHFLKSIVIELDNSQTITLPISSLECDGLNSNNSLFNYPNNAFSGYKILQEYFILPQKFFFFKLANLDKLKKYSNISSFKIIFNFKNSSITLNSFSNDAIKLFCTPISNIFEEHAEPITLKHNKELIRVHAPLKYNDKCQVYDVKKITSYIQGELENKNYFPFESFEDKKKNVSFYQVHRKKSIINSKEELFLELHYDSEIPTSKEVLSMDITCTNSTHSERLKLGEISQGSDNSPELTTFKNIIPCTMQIDSPLSENSLWQFVSHLSINLLTLADMKTFKDMLKLYIFSNNRDKNKVAKNQKRIDAIEEFRVEIIDKVSRGYLLKGHKVFMEIRGDYFASTGDVYLFGTVILRFLSSYAALNTFVELEVKEIITGESLTWHPILGNKKLI
ncbi:MAG: type VI secretion system baseplate subunit TssF [Helicobacteraceae bacterium]|nr:type VI secretion system baseplate subunit TssF [Helicobacteraceae bacterium]